MLDRQELERTGWASVGVGIKRRTYWLATDWMTLSAKSRECRSASQASFTRLKETDSVSFLAASFLPRPRSGSG